ERERALGAYERFCDAFAAMPSDQPMWGERVRTVRDGLAGFYVSCGRMDDAQVVFERRHAEESDSILVALSASRVFLAAGAVSRAMSWLATGADRAARLGRADMAERLRKKQDALRSRQS